MNSDDIEDENVDRTLLLSEMKKKGKNLKIVIENEAVGGDGGSGDGGGEDLFDYEELKEDEVTGNVSRMDIDVGAPSQPTTVHDDDADVVAVADEEDATEFHVNLNKAPPTLQNTILNEKIYLNEQNEEEKKEKNIDVVIEGSLKALYESLDMDEESFVTSVDVIPNAAVAASNTELFTGGMYKKNSLHIFGVDDLNTNEVFEFFKGYQPFAIEWINDSSCNVLWKDVNHCLNALIDLTEPYELPSEPTMGRRQPPRGSRWRVSLAKIEKTGNLLYIRFTRRTDRKVKGAESRSKFYVKYGNPNYGNMRGLISESRRRRMKHMQLKSATSDLTLDDEQRTEGGEPEEEEETEEEKTNDLTGRKLISYNLESAMFRRRVDADISIDELEEFGTGASTKTSSSARIDLELAKKKPFYKSKKMHLYSDELNPSAKRSMRDDDDDDNHNDNDDDHDDRNRYHRPYDRSQPPQKRLNRYEPYSRQHQHQHHHHHQGSSHRPPSNNTGDLRHKLNSMVGGSSRQRPPPPRN